MDICSKCEMWFIEIYEFSVKKYLRYMFHVKHFNELFVFLGNKLQFEFFLEVYVGNLLLVVRNTVKDLLMSASYVKLGEILKCFT